MISKTWRFERQNLSNYASESAITGLSRSAMCNVGPGLLVPLHWVSWFYWFRRGCFYSSQTLISVLFGPNVAEDCASLNTKCQCRDQKKLRLHGFWIFAHVKIIFQFLLSLWRRKSIFYKSWDHDILSLLNTLLFLVRSINLSQLILVESTSV